MSVTTFVRTIEQLNWAGMICAQANVPACYEGDPGTGKTETIKCLSDYASRFFASYELSRTQPEDLGGFPVVAQRTIKDVVHEFMRFVPDERLLNCEICASTLLLDEVTNAGPVKQAPALNLVQNGLPDCWMFMACNPIHNAADGHALTQPFVNRIWYGKWQIDEEAQRWGIRHRCEFPEPSVPLVPENYMDYQPRWGCSITDYLDYFPQHFNDCPKDSSKHGLPFPSSRQWSNLSKCLAACEAVDGNTATRNAIIRGLIGQAVGEQFISYLAEQSLPSAEDILKETIRWDATDYTFDKVMVICNAVLNYVRRHDEEETRHQLHRFWQETKSQNPEIAAAMAKDVSRIIGVDLQLADKQKIMNMANKLES
jgi:hypothetical protein